MKSEIGEKWMKQGEIKYFETQINNCKIEGVVDSSQFNGDRRRISYSINRFYNLNEINELKRYYADCQHPYVTWTFLMCMLMQTTCMVMHSHY
jgi:hypothetical protein